MNVISKEQLDNIRTSVDIVSVISQYMTLEHRGSNFWGACPFHGDEHPSMCVSPDKQIFTCFVCHKTGNVFNFVMDYEHISFPEAVAKVATIAGIKVDVAVHHENELSNNLYKIYQDTEKIYQNNLNISIAHEAREYLTKREIDDNIIKEFGIGLSLKKRDILVKSFLDNKKYSQNDLLDSGLVVKNEYGMIDIYQNRIMFPLWDLNGRIVGFSGRRYDTEEGPKYINSKETDIFKKRELIYNYHRSRDICREKDTVIVMEGFMDVIGLYKEGITNTIAMMGTAVTKYQANIIKRMAHNIILLFDGDNAGVNAAMRSIDEFLGIGVTPKVVVLEENLDPDEYIKKYGKNKFLEKIEYPMNIIDFKLRYLKQGKDLTSDVEKASYANDVLKQLKNVHDDILIELTLKKLSIETNLDIDFLRNKVKSDVEPQKEVQKSALEVKTHKHTKNDKYIKAMQLLLYYMLINKEAVKAYMKIVTHIPIDKYRFLARFVEEYYKRYQKVDIAGIIDEASSDETISITIQEIASMKEKDDIKTEDIVGLAHVVQEYNIKNEIKRLEAELKKATITADKVKFCEEIRKLKVRGNE